MHVIRCTASAAQIDQRGEIDSVFNVPQHKVTVDALILRADSVTVIVKDHISVRGLHLFTVALHPAADSR